MMQSLRESIAERVAQRIEYFPWWVMHPIQYHRSERFRRAIEMIAREFIDISYPDAYREIYLGSEVAYEHGQYMVLGFEPTSSVEEMTK